MRSRCDVNRSFWFWASIVCLRFLAERSCADGQGFSHRSSEASRRETLTGSLPVCMIRRKTKAKRQNRFQKWQLESLLTSFALGDLGGIAIPMKKNAWRALIEVGFIIFLFYSNLLMGEFERSGWGQKKGLIWAIADVFTAANFEIAAVAALVGYVVFEFLRKRF